MYIVLILLLLIILFSSIIYYYYKFITRISSVFEKNINKKLLIFLSIILSLLSVNMFSVIGLFFIHFLLISLSIDLVFLVFKKIIKNKKIINIYKLGVFPLIITLIIMLFGFINIRNIVETKYTIYTDKEIGSDIRVLLITDSHYGDIFNKSSLDSLLFKLNSVDADIVILGGDIVDESTSKSEMEYVFKVFGSIKNKMGIYYVYGNHDEQRYSTYKKYTFDELHSTINKNNINILSDSYKILDNNIVIVGRNDYSYGRENIDTYLKDVSLDNYFIMVDHQPVSYSSNISFGIDLILSGHTHGGQIFPVESLIKIFNTADLSYGYERFENMDAIVSSGVAGWGYPIRTSNHSEYVVIDIKRVNPQ